MAGLIQALSCELVYSRSRGDGFEEDDKMKFPMGRVNRIQSCSRHSEKKTKGRRKGKMAPPTSRFHSFFSWIKVESYRTLSSRSVLHCDGLAGKSQESILGASLLALSGFKFLPRCRIFPPPKPRCLMPLNTAAPPHRRGPMSSSPTIQLHNKSSGSSSKATATAGRVNSIMSPHRCPLEPHLS